MSDRARGAMEQLARMDAYLDERVERRTLDPVRERATALEDLGLAMSARLSDAAIEAWTDGLLATVRSILEHFPDNLLWDLDHLAAGVAREAVREPSRAVERVRASFGEIVELHALFGRATPIRFRYAHDFVYGFDWAKWVRRAPAERACHGPFDLVFLRAMRARGEELLELIAHDDAKYPRLRDEERARNPFPFSREPSAELALYADLARRGLIPVPAWSIDAPPVWDAPYAEEREARARALGL